MITTGVPVEIDRLWSRLVAAGFARHTDDGDAPFGNRCDTFSRDGFQVRTVLDRSEWWIEVAGSATDFYDPDIWQACLDGAAAPLEPSTLSERAGIVVSRLDELATAGATEQVRECLRRRGLERTERRLGSRGDGRNGAD